MSRSESNTGRHAATPTDDGHAQVAALAAKLSALPSKSSPGSGSPHSVPYARSWLAILALSSVWLITATLGVLAALRIFYHDGVHLLTWVNAFTRYVYLPAYACLIVATWKRRRWLAIANLAIIGCHLWWVFPDFSRDSRFDPTASSASVEAQSRKAVRIFFANVRGQNNEYTALVHEIEAANPDVIILVEFSPEWREAFRDSPFLATFPYGNRMTKAQYESVNTFSRLPVKSDSGEWITGRYVNMIEIPLGTETLRVVGLHAPRPSNLRMDNYDSYWNRLIPLLLGLRGPTVIIGDCNATQYSLVYEQLKAGGLRSAHEDRGRGCAVSWPNGRGWLPPIRIDQAFLTPDVACLEVAEGEGRGSDHKPLILDVQIRDHP